MSGDAHVRLCERLAVRFPPVYSPGLSFSVA